LINLWLKTFSFDKKKFNHCQPCVVCNFFGLRTVFDDILLELPVPKLGELSDMRTLRHTVRKERSPNALCYSYADLCDLDTVTVALVPEKKGLILKHVEYEVSSQV